MGARNGRDLELCPSAQGRGLPQGNPKQRPIDIKNNGLTKDLSHFPDLPPVVAVRRLNGTSALLAPRSCSREIPEIRSGYPAAGPKRQVFVHRQEREKTAHPTISIPCPVADERSTSFRPFCISRLIMNLLPGTSIR